MRKMMFRFLLLVACLTLSPQARADVVGWTQFGGPSGNFVATTAEGTWAASQGLRQQWRVTLGAGLSSIVVADELLYVTYLKPFSEADAALPESDRHHIEGVAALRRHDGSVVWDHHWEAGWLDSQEAFGGKSRAPQATPLIQEDRLIVLGFTGWLHCLDRTSGRLLWKKNLVDDCAAQPVQFGFSASPIVNDGQLIVLAGGQKGGLVAMDLTTGDPIWNVPCEEASYATPVCLDVDGETQIVFVTREDVIGVAAGTGAARWRFPLPKAGMTNVPTPLPLGEGRLALSGQGVGGTCELRLSRIPGRSPAWEATEGWRSRAEFFYCNWLLQGDRIIGCSGDLLLIIDARTGERLARWRGFRDSNLVRAGDQYLIVDGEGALSLAKDSDAGWDVMSRYQLLEDRCWAPISLVGDQLYCRGGTEVACFAFAANNEDAALQVTQLEVKKRRLPIKGVTGDPADEMDEDPIQQIVDAFESQGASAAWKTYLGIRESAREAFSLEQRQDLAEMAMDQGLIDFGKQILQHAVEDFGNDASRRLQTKVLQQYDRQPSRETAQGDNGLLYLELGVQNQGERTIHAVVKGPSQHPFSYGIPFPPGKLRIEKWPVGTRLFRAHDEVPGEVLLTVDADDAGTIIKFGGATSGE